jgi:glutathione-regulated potassium-efflux system ancillary protein KefG
MRTMVIVAHPNLNNSEWNQKLISELKKHPDIHIRDLYEEYPNWSINIEREQQLLTEYDRIVFQFPFYWYSSPPLLKKWFDDVLTYGWAFGPGGDKLSGKTFMLATTTGGSENDYQSGGYNWFTMNEYLRPIQSTITRCNGTLLPLFVAYSPTTDSIAYDAKRYVDSIHSSQAKLAQ